MLATSTAAFAFSVPAGRVFIKRAGAPGGFAPVAIFRGDAVCDVAKRAAFELNWCVTADRVSLFVVDAAHAEAVEGGFEANGVGRRLFSGAKLGVGEGDPQLSVGDGCFLLARLDWLVAAAAAAAVASADGTASEGLRLTAAPGSLTTAGADAEAGAAASVPVDEDEGEDEAAEEDQA